MAGHDRTAAGSDVLGRIAAIFGIAALAVTQPILDLFGKNPEFFVAGNYSSSQIVFFAVVVAVVPALIGAGIVAAVSLINRQAGDLVFAVVIGLFAAGFVLAVLRNVGVDPIVVVLLLGVVGGALAALVVYRTRGGRLLAGYLAVANLAFVGLFLFGSRDVRARRRRVEPGPR